MPSELETPSGPMENMSSIGNEEKQLEVLREPERRVATVWGRRREGGRGKQFSLRVTQWREWGEETIWGRNVETARVHIISLMTLAHS